MNFTIEDRRNIELFVEILKAAMANQKYLTVSIDSEGWFLAQSPERLDDRENDQLVSIIWLQNSFFLFHSVDQGSQTRLNSCTFEIDITTIFKTLTSVKKQIKKITLMVKRGSSERRGERNDRLGCLQILSSLEESQFLIEKKIIFQSIELDRAFYKGKLRNFEEDKIRLFEIENEELAFIKDFKNYFLELLFHKEFIRVKPAHCPKDIVTDLNKLLLSRYDNEALETHYGGKTKLTLPPNFLISYNHLCKKMNHNIEIFFGKSFNDHINVYCKAANEKVTVLMNFSALLEQNDSENQPNPFENQAAFQNINHILNQAANRQRQVNPVQQSFPSENNESAANSFPDSNPFSRNNFMDSYQEPAGNNARPQPATAQVNNNNKPTANPQPSHHNPQNNSRLKNKISPLKDYNNNEGTKRMKLNSFNDERVPSNIEAQRQKSIGQAFRSPEELDSMKIEEESELDSFVPPMTRNNPSQINVRPLPESRTQQSVATEQEAFRPPNNALFSLFGLEKNYLQSSAESTGNMSAFRANLQRNEKKVAENKQRREDMIRTLRPFD